MCVGSPEEELPGSGGGEDKASSGDVGPDGVDDAGPLLSREEVSDVYVAGGLVEETQE